MKMFLVLLVVVCAVGYGAFHFGYESGWHDCEKWAAEILPLIQSALRE